MKAVEIQNKRQKEHQPNTILHMPCVCLTKKEKSEPTNIDINLVALIYTYSRLSL